MRYLVLKLILLLLMSSEFVEAQKFPLNVDRPHSLSVGQIVPNILIANIVNNERTSVYMSDYREKLVILDFWSTMCKACIEAFPKMEILQQKFGNQLKILPVNYESKAMVTAFFKRTPYNLPSVTDDKVLSKWFKHRSMPHEVWIHKGKVIAITDGQYVDAKNVAKVLKGDQINWPIKNDFYIFDYKKQLLQTQINNPNGRNPVYTAVLGYQEGALPKVGRDTINGMVRNYILNYSILRAYSSLWKEVVKVKQINSTGNNITSGYGGFTPTQLILEIKDSSKYVYKPEYGYREEWNRKNDISYEWVSSLNSSEKQIQYSNIITDLDRLLGLRGRWEKREQKCLILVQDSPVDNLKSQGGETKFIFDGTIKKLINAPLSTIIFWMNSIAGNPPMYDESNIKYLVNMDLKIKSWVDIPELKKELQRYGLDLKEENRIIDIFVLSETNN